MKMIIAICLYWFGHIVVAGQIDDALVKRIMLDRQYGEKVFIELEKRHTNLASCHSNNHWQYVLDISDDYGKAMFSSILSLHLAGRKALFNGTDNCSLYRNIETLSRIEAK
jgi:hypothetical protein